jgi:predicted histone-like DNA-binding protein
MADNKISLQYDLKQLNNDASSAHLKWFPWVVRKDTLNLRGLADHISEHGSIYTQDVVEGVLKKFTSCMVELIKQGIGVKLDGLGTFYPTIEAKGADTPVDYDLSEKFLGLHIRFTPEGAKLDRITSRALLQQVAFRQHMIFDVHGVPKKVKDGQLVDYGDDNDNNNG